MMIKQIDILSLFEHPEYNSWIQNHQIDLHIHSRFSDGMDTVEELLEKIQQAGIGIFSLTDHDNVDGVKHVLSEKCMNDRIDISLFFQTSPISSTSKIVPISHLFQTVPILQPSQTPQTPHPPKTSQSSHPLLFIPGIEFSCKLEQEESEKNGLEILDESGKRKECEFHILGYGMDLNHPDFLEAIRINRESRIRKVAERIDFLARHGYPQLGEADVQALLQASDNPGKPHIVNWMEARGLINGKDPSLYDSAKASREDIFRLLKEHHSQERNLTPAEAIRGIRQAGGVAVLAHGVKGSGSDSFTLEQTEKRVVYLKEQGLQGLECYYSPYEPHGYQNGFTTEQQEMMLYLAEKYGLYITAGSDYHGSNKPDVLLGRKKMEIEEK